MEKTPVSLVFDVVVYTIECPIILKTCRLVCRSWNSTASEKLRAISRVTIDERLPAQIEKFEKVRAARRRTVLKKLPSSPFRKIRLVATSFTEPNFLSAVNNLGKDLIISELSLLNAKGDPQSKNVDVPIHILANHASTLTTLRIDWDNFHEKLNPSQFLEMPNLTSAHLIVGPHSEQALKNLLTRPQIKTLCLRFQEFFPTCLRSTNWEGISEVKLCIKQSKSILDSVSDPIQNLLQIPSINVTELTLQGGGRVEVEIPQLVSKWAESIQLLQIETPNLSVVLPPCPKVKKLVLVGTFRPDLSEKVFPSLKKIVILKAPAEPLFERPISNRGVEEIVYEHCSRSMLDDLTPFSRNDSLCDTVKALTKCFPNVNNFYCDIRKYCERYSEEERPLAGKLSKVFKKLHFPGIYKIKY